MVLLKAPASVIDWIVCPGAVPPRVMSVLVKVLLSMASLNTTVNTDV